jgi:hypothetical protein
MSNSFIAFEHKFGLSPRQAATLLGYPPPTYYQYRRTGDAPTQAFRYLEILMSLPDDSVGALILKYLHPRKAQDDEL